MTGRTSPLVQLFVPPSHPEARSRPHTDAHGARNEAARTCWSSVTRWRVPLSGRGERGGGRRILFCAAACDPAEIYCTHHRSIAYVR